MGKIDLHCGNDKNSMFFIEKGGFCMKKSFILSKKIVKLACLALIGSGLLLNGSLSGLSSEELIAAKNELKPIKSETSSEIRMLLSAGENILSYQLEGEDFVVVTGSRTLRGVVYKDGIARWMVAGKDGQQEYPLTNKESIKRLNALYDKFMADKALSELEAVIPKEEGAASGEGEKELKSDAEEGSLAKDLQDQKKKLKHVEKSKSGDKEKHKDIVQVEGETELKSEAEESAFTKAIKEKAKEVKEKKEKK